MDLPSDFRAVLLSDSARLFARLGQRVEETLAALRSASEAERVDAEYACAEAVWRYFVQREACGLRSHVQVIETYGIPGAVLAKVGAQRPPSGG